MKGWREEIKKRCGVQEILRWSTLALLTIGNQRPALDVYNIADVRAVIVHVVCIEHAALVPFASQYSSQILFVSDLGC